MEEDLKDALLRAGEHLAEALRAGLAAHGMSNELSLLVEDGRVVVASRSVALRRAELGSADASPRGTLEGLARETAAQVVGRLARHLEGSFK